ncbi:MAG: ribosome biogenesis GTPase Der [Chloroflexi bacterium]|nr:ribosome biogenesis GTPase Der [Chloroflexota bacterium]
MSPTDRPDATAPLVAIVGRPNVGKSALFNRLTRSRRALVERLAGTTRDRQYGWCTWRERRFRVVDTGGLESADGGIEDTLFAQPIREQVAQALGEAQLLLFVVDASSGTTSDDHAVAEQLRRAGRPVLLVANKSDRRAAQSNVHELHGLGLGEPRLISAYHAEGVGDLLDMIVERLPDAEPGEEPPAQAEEGTRPIRIAIVGRPNVGKSSLVNAILGEERTIVSELPGTTRDAIDTPFTFERWPMVLVDTAGIRRRGKIERGVERHAAQQAERAIARADVVFMLIDPAEPTAAQDAHIAGRVVDHGKGLALVVSKWDLAEPGTDRHRYARRLDGRYRFAPWAPVHFTSALTGAGIPELLQLAVNTDEVRRRRVQTAEMNRMLQRAIVEHPPRYVGRRRLKLLYVTQAEVEPPTFVFFVNDPELLHFAYQRFLENRIREAFGFEGTAIRLRFRGRSEEQAEVEPPGGVVVPV